MNAAKITITLDQDLLNHVDRLVQSRLFRSRSNAIQSALREQVSRVQRTRLEQECAKLNPVEEQSFADAGLASEAGQWPPY